MASVNKVMVLGNMGRDPEIRYTQGGDAIANLSIATSEKWKDKSGEQHERTEWSRVVLFGRQAEVAGEYLKKGSTVWIEGRLQTRKYTDKDGVERYTTEIVADRMQMIGSRREREEGGGDSGGGASASDYQRAKDGTAPAGGSKKNVDDFDDEIPFATNADCFDGAPLRLLRLRRQR